MKYSDYTHRDSVDIISPSPFLERAGERSAPPVDIDSVDIISPSLLEIIN